MEGTMVNRREQKQMIVRLSESEREAFQQVCDELGLTTQQGLAELITRATSEKKIPASKKTVVAWDTSEDAPAEGESIKNKLPNFPAGLIPEKVTRSHVFTFWGTKGGVGKTTVALNTGAYISAITDLRVITVDMDEFGDIGLSIGADMKRGTTKLPTATDFVANLDSMKTFGDLAPFILRENNTGLYVMTASENASNPRRLSKAQYQEIVRVLKQHFDVIIFDCGVSLYNDYTRFALAAADAIFMVVDQGYPTLHQMSNVIHEFSQEGSGIGRSKLVLVVNKCLKGNGMPLKNIQEWFDPGVSAMKTIPFWSNSLKTLNSGDFAILAESMPLKEAYREVASEVLRRMR
jgi:cellulose biosynthesis protein BcsQ